MATFTVEDGTVVADATSYVSLEDFEDYLSVKPNINAAWADLDDTAKESYLMWATRLLDQRVRWAGSKTDETSPLRWPRTYVYDRDGYLIDPNTIPEQLKDAVCELAYFLYNESADPSAPPSVTGAAAGIEKIKADVIEIQYSTSTSVSSNTYVMPPGLALILKPIGVLQGAGGTKFVRITRT